MCRKDFEVAAESENGSSSQAGRDDSNVSVVTASECSHRRSQDSTVSADDSLLGASLDDSKAGSSLDTRPPCLPDTDPHPADSTTDAAALNFNEGDLSLDLQNPNKFLSMLNRDSGVDSSSVGSGGEGKASKVAPGYASSSSFVGNQRREKSKSGRRRKDVIAEREVPVSFLIVRISPAKPPCISLRLAFLGGTSGVVRQRVSQT